MEITLSRFQLGKKSTRKKSSVLPTVSGEPTPGQGFALMDSGDTMRVALLKAVGAILWLGLGSTLVVVSWNSGEWLPVLICTVLTAGGVWFATYAYRELQVVRTFHPATLEVKPWPLQLGDTATLRYQRRARKRTRIRYIDAQVSVEEEATYQVGTTTETVTHTVWRQGLSRQQATEGDAQNAESTWEVQIPSHLPASFKAAHNKIGWEVETCLHYGQNRKDRSTYSLLVAPKVCAKPETTP